MSSKFYFRRIEVELVLNIYWDYTVCSRIVHFKTIHLYYMNFISRYYLEKNCFICMCVGLNVCIYVHHMIVGTHRGQKKAIAPLELEL